MILLLRCPACKQTQRYQYTDSTLDKKRKRCVYCGKSFSVRPQIVKKES